jgi:CRISPR-associated protein Cas5h
MKLISFDLYADMGFLKKPDINEKIYLTFNMLHKPCVLGVLGAIAGLKGFSKNNEFPEYYEKLKHIPIGIKPIGEHCENGNFTKNVTTYTNTIGFANTDGNLIVSEQTLINPAFRIFLLLDDENEIEKLLYQRISNQEAEYIPYLGKNDYSVWWCKDDIKNENGEIIFQGIRNYELLEDEFNKDYKIESVFIKKRAVVDSVVEDDSDDDFGEFEFADFGSYMYFEKLPTEYCTKLYQYKYADFALTDSKLKAGSLLTRNLYHLRDIKTQNEVIVQLN